MWTLGLLDPLVLQARVFSPCTTTLFYVPFQKTVCPWTDLGFRGEFPLPLWDFRDSYLPHPPSGHSQPLSLRYRVRTKFLIVRDLFFGPRFSLLKPSQSASLQCRLCSTMG